MAADPADSSMPPALAPGELRFVPTADGLPGAAPDARLVVLDAAWTAPPQGRGDVLAARSMTRDILAERDPLGEAMRRLDAWAGEAGLVERLESGGWSWWYRRRLVAWRGLHERLVWLWLLERLAADGRVDTVTLPTRQGPLNDAVAMFAASRGWQVVVPPPPPVAPAVPAPKPRTVPWPIGPMLWRLGRHPNQRGPEAERRRVVAGRTQAMLERLARLRADPGRLLVLTSPSTHQTIGGPDAPQSRDPFLGAVVDALAGTPLEPIVLEIGADVADDTAWARLSGSDGQRHLALPIAVRAMDDPADVPAAEVVRAQAAERLAEPMPPLEVGGIDVAPWIAGEVRRHVAGESSGLTAELLAVPRLRRLIDALRPAALLLINEYSNPEWLIAASGAGVPVVAVQHGIIHRHHAGYIIPTRRGLPLADLTCVFGAYEARLLTGSSVYRPEEVEVTGAPRLDLVRGMRDDRERTAVRSSLGVGPGDRMLVFSSTSSTSVRESTFAVALDALLDGPWPGIHLVVKLHPAEVDDGFYARLVGGIARARGFEPPRLSVVKQVDLFALLRAADAHLGVMSTVLTDAVAAGTRNLIAAGLAGSDLLGYVDAGVAEPVRNSAELVAAMQRPEPADIDDRRAAFLADHFAQGPSAPRIAAAVEAMARGATPGGVAVRPATMEDADLLLAWANDPVTRAAGFHTAAISRDEHLAWLARRLATADCRLYIGVRAGRPVGQVRVDRDEPTGTAEVSIAVAPEARGQGVGRRLLDAALAAARADAQLGVGTFRARVRPDNAASLALFRGAGFVEAGSGEEASIPYLAFERG